MQWQSGKVKQCARLFALALLSWASLGANAAQWENVSGTTVQNGAVLELTGGAVTSKAMVTNIAVVQGQQYTLGGQVSNSAGGSWTYIGLNNGGVVTERGRNSTSYSSIAPITFVATSSTVSVYGSFWQGQAGKGYVKALALNGVDILDGSQGGGGNPTPPPGTYNWVNVSGQTSVSNSVLQLTGSPQRALAELAAVAVTPGTLYSLTGNYWNTAGYTYIGLENGSQYIERGGNQTASTAISSISFVAAGSTVRILGSYWQNQAGQGFVSNLKLNGVALLASGGAGTGNCAGTYTFCDDFNGTALDPALWYKVRKNWGGQVNGANSYNGGVLPENVSLYGGYLYLEGHGDLYTGTQRGINKNGTVRVDGKKVGAGIASTGYYGSGTYEVRMKALPRFGAVSTIWTFHYQEIPAGTSEYNANNGSGDYWISNHEIDIEMPGRPAAAASNISFNYALFNNWRGERESPQEYVTGYTDTGLNNADGNFHVYKIEWHTGSATNRNDSFVKFYIDGVLKRTLSGNAGFVPFKKGRFWLANWFARNWAGIADFDTAQMVVDYARFTAANDPNDVTVAESYPCDGLVGCQ